MLTPLEYLEKRLSGNNWILNYSMQKIYQDAYAYFQQYAYSDQIIFISTEDKLDFLARFIAAASTNTTVVLAQSSSCENGSMKCSEQFSQKILLPTGGSSGEVKFAIHTWQTLCASVDAFTLYFDSPCVNSLCILPLFHVSGLMQAIRTLITGGSLAIYDYKQIKQKPAQLLNFQNYFLSLVPTQLEYLLEFYPEWVGQFKTVLLGGAPARTSLLNAARKAKIALALTYGMTETASQVVALKPKDFLEGNNSSGKILPHSHVTIRGEDGSMLQSGEVGIVLVEANSLCLGYYPSNIEYSSPFQTDDLGYFDKNGFLYIVGRKSQKIITGGEKVYPKEVEDAIFSTFLVKDVVVVGTKDNYWGEAVVAIFVPNLGFNLEELKGLIKSTLSPHKIPKKWIQVREIPRNQQGKIVNTQINEIISFYVT